MMYIVICFGKVFLYVLVAGEYPFGHMCTQWLFLQKKIHPKIKFS